MSFIKKAKDFVPSQSLKYLLHNHLSGSDPARPLKTMHASELTKGEGICPRYYALMDVTKTKPKDGWLSTSEEVTYELGRMLQDRVVNWFADMGRAVGHWRCLACNQFHSFQKRPKKCECGGKGFKPEEVRFISAQTGASCGVDMLVSSDAPKLMPVEIKTIDKEQFKGLVGPLAEHRQRTNLYLRIIAESEQSWSSLVDTTKGVILYISKGGFGCLDPELKKWGLYDQYSPFKEYTVTRSDASTDEMSRRARVVKQFREGEVGMPSGVCSTAMSKRAGACAMRKACFSGDHPPKYDWK